MSALGSKIFLVDDHPLVREGLARLIEQDGRYVVCGQAEDVPGALAGIAETRPDLVLVDISLKGVSGLELLGALRDRTDGPRTLVLSMYDELAYAERALQLGARGYVMKQRAVADVLTAIERVLAGQLYVSDPVKDRIVAAVASSTRSGATPTELLTPRELEIFHLVGAGKKTREIAALLHLSPKTVDTHYQNIKTKLQLRSAGELAQRAVLWVNDRARG